MLKKLKGKIIEALISVLPVTLIVIILNLTPLLDFSAKEIGLFCGCAVLLLLVVDSAKKNDIMYGFYDDVGVGTPAQGIAFAMPIEDVVGIESCKEQG